ncbi:hypothetical protein [Pleionea litopenaei]|uniref:Uncharacterized protein n=1 Tax=Pleionea litopenaei TaxID=3070815 RepID=A0AA51X5F3_9GAMM|nr:hypothetical protein [Pleionea sp. HL-JVS1]WMS85868.1 hypothetical protein Q9312_11630 [Pleionea sp. HL-JVS1]
MENIMIVSAWLFGWGSLALINAVLAQSKKRSGLNWLLISLLLGPITTLSLAILEPTLDD